MSDLVDVDDQISSQSSSVSISSTSDCLQWTRYFFQMDRYSSCFIIAIVLILIIALLRYLFTCDLRRPLIIVTNLHDGNDNDIDECLTKSNYSTPSKTMPVTVLLNGTNKDGKFSSSFIPVMNEFDTHKNFQMPPKYYEACNAPVQHELIQENGNGIGKKIICDNNIPSTPPLSDFKPKENTEVV